MAVVVDLIKRQQASPGFTLIEILVVLVIMTIATMFAVLAFHNRDSDQVLKRQGEYLLEQIELAKLQALLQPALIGLSITQQGYRFFYYEAPNVGDPQQGRWQAYTRWQGLGGGLFSDSIQLGLQVQGKTLALPGTLTDALPAIIFSMTGTITPFVLELGSTESSIHYALTGNFGGQVDFQKISERSWIYAY